MAKQHLPRMKYLSYLLIYVMGVLPLHPAIGAGIESANNQTQVIQQGNIPIVNIAPPNNAGVSHNTYQDFNVGAAGSVLNNATNEAQSVLAGQIGANPNFKGKAADLIINEVTSSGYAQLEGQLEVAGQKANLLIASPRGITCDGCSFINTPSVTLSTGKPVFAPDGALQALEVKGGTISIGKKGLDATAQDYVDIISLATTLDGKIQAKNLALTLGANKVDFQKGLITPVKGESHPLLAVDASELGGMYANKIRLISTLTKQDLHLPNITAQQDDITLTTDGKIIVKGDITAKTDLNISTNESVSISEKNKLMAGKDITIAAGAVYNAGNVNADKDMRLFVNRLENRNNKTGKNLLIPANIVAKNNLWLQRDAQGKAADYIDNTSSNLKTHEGNIFIRTKRLFNNEKADLKSGAHAYINANDLFNNRGYIYAKKNLILTGSKYESGFGTLASDKYSSGLGTLASNSNVVADFRDAFTIENGASSIHGENILLKSPKIKINYDSNPPRNNDVYIMAKNDLSIISDEYITMNDTVLSGKNNVMLAGKELIEFERSAVRGKNIDLITGNGSIRFLDNNTFNHEGSIITFATNNMISAENNLGLSSTLSMIIDPKTTLKGKNITLFSSEGELKIHEGKRFEGKSIEVSDNFQLNARGNIIYDDVTLKANNIDISSKEGEVILSGQSIIADDNLQLRAKRNIKLNDVTLKANNIDIYSKNNAIRFKGKDITANNNLKLRAATEIRNYYKTGQDYWPEIKGNNIDISTKTMGGMSFGVMLSGVPIFAKNNLNILSKSVIDTGALTANNISLNADRQIKTRRAYAIKDLLVKAPSLGKIGDWKGENVEFHFPLSNFNFNSSEHSISAKNLTISAANSIFIPQKLPNTLHNVTLATDENIKIYSSAPEPFSAVTGNIKLLAGKDINSDVPVFAQNNIELVANDNILLSRLQAKNIILNAGKYLNTFHAEATKNLSLTTHNWGQDNYWKGENVELNFPRKSIQLDSRYIRVSAKNLTVTAGKDLKVTEKLSYPLHNATFIAGNNLNFFPNIPYSGEGTTLLDASGNINLLAGNDIHATKTNLIAGQQITLNAGRDILMRDDNADDGASNIHFDESSARIISSATKLIAGDNLQLNAGRDILARSASLTAKAGDISINSGRHLALSAFGYADLNYNYKYLPIHLNAARNLTLAAAGQLSTSGANLTSGHNMTITTGGNIRFESVQEYHEEKNSARTRQRPSQLNSGGELKITSQGSILFQATSLIAKGMMDIAAKGGVLYAQAMNEDYQWEETKKKCNSFLGIRSCRVFGSKTETHRKVSSTNKPTEFIAGGDINLMAKDDVTLEASRIETNKNAKITSQTGRVSFKAMPNTAFEQTVSTAKGFFITHQDKGSDETVWAIPSVRVGGTLTVDVAKGISADAKMKEGQTLEEVLTTLGNTPGTEWLKGLKDRNDIQWNLVKDAYTSWDKKSEQLNPVAGAVIAIAVAAVTSGSGLAAWAGKGAVGATGATGAAASAVYGAAYAGMIGLTTQAAVALVENKGNLSGTLKALAKSDSVKSLVTRMAVGGALGSVDHVMGWGKVVENTKIVDPVEVQLPLPLSNHGWGEAARRVAAHSVVSSTLGSAINGGSFADNLRADLLNNLGNQIHAYGAGLIGDKGEILGHPGKSVSHAVLSGMVAEITGGDAKGAAVGALAAELAAISLGENTLKAEEWAKAAETQAQIVRVLGGFAGAVVTGKAGGVQSGATAAETTFRYNYLAHHQTELRDKELAAEPNPMKRGLIHIKWGLTSANQDGAALAGVVSGVPEELSDTVVAILGAAANYKETLQALKKLINSDSIMNTVYQAEKADFIKRLDTIEQEYERAGLIGAYNYGVETGKLITKMIGYVAVVKGGASAATNTFRTVGSKFSGLKNTEGMVSIRDVVRIEKDGSKTSMSWTEGNYKQGYPFEDFVGKELKLPESARLPYGSETFDYFTPNRQAISVKTLNTTTASRLQKPEQISSQLNGYINEMAKFEKTTKGEFKINNDMIKQKTLYLAVPEKTTPTQWAEINKSISYAADKNIDVKVTIVRGDAP
ncbi:filamentous hemagglutinin N-terminal domain-containing protein [Xenorhabdus sp. 12]|uniref:Filamentous hemagglutinin N-terminal domain-containing protein n=1 Tax=Xenorhabdus santafensis TaxID=2582833 RepID=A0ABU4SD10_9GAMM|nr:DUF637 domain-containing protein [Xenorhabdus sp. 12]MDX7988700.1 filamentous hemagglutinin N-terminal domain-containing protein [Xenorhabdus sp. 12]